MNKGMQYHKDAVKSGAWLLYNYDPSRPAGNPLRLQSGYPNLPIAEYFKGEARFHSHDPAAQGEMDETWKQVQREAVLRRKLYEHLATREVSEE